ncbi:MAG: tetratricopeptide repeat protein [Candidatus Eiseniibacteriota bacterium]|nr:MAG: tetratricopeptide repeat protein [Candidatus Eisenbacteria bacterium]
MSVEASWQKIRNGISLPSLLLFFILSIALVSPGFSQPRDSVVAQKLIQERLERVRADSLNPVLRYELANAFHDAGKKHEALLHYDKAVALKPDHLEALVNRGVVLNELGRIDDAIASFERALSVNPRDPKAMLNLGNSLYALQRYDDAMARYKLAASVDSTFVEAYYYIGIAFADAGIYREAIREWQRILEIAPGSEVARNAKDNIDVLMVFLSGK